MSRKTKERLHLIYGIVLSVLLIAAGVCFALSCLSIYQSGRSPFTRESIAAHFDRISILVYICIAGVAGGGVLSLALPLERGRVKPRHDELTILKKRSEKVDLSACEASVRNRILGERKFRRAVTVTVGILSGITLLPAILWCVNPAHFSIENLNADIRTAAAFVIPCAAVALGLWVAAVLLRGASAARETEALKTAALAAFNARVKGKVIVGGKTAPEGTKEEKASPDTVKPKGKLTAATRVLWGVRGVILVIGVIFIVLGVLNGGMADVLGKAIRICTECIGLG